MDSEYTNIEMIFGSSIDDAVEMLLAHKRNGEKVSTVFNGTTLYSDTVTLDGAYKAIVGKTRAEYQASIHEMRERHAREEKEYQLSIPKLTVEWIEKGRNILDKKYWEQWEACIPIRLSDLYHGMELGDTLEIVKRLNAGCDFSEAKTILDNQGHSGMSYGLVCSMIRSFCDRGKGFVDTLKLD